MNAAAGLTIDGLVEEARGILAELGLLGAHEDGRVTPAPDVRIVRYYGTLGLVDRPVYEGREARYGRRHVLQVVAVKVLQSLGLPLAEVQARLYGKSNGELESLLKAAGEARPRRAPVRPVLWREVVIEPGLKLMVEDGWRARSDLIPKIKAVLEAMTVDRRP